MKSVRRVAALFSAIAITVMAASSALAWDSAAEIERLKSEVPSAATFGGNGSVVWLRGSESRMLNDGSMEIFSTYVVMIGEKVPDDWKTRYFPVPAEGGLEVEEAAWYNPMTGMKEGSLPVRDEKLPGGAVVKTVSLPNDTVGRVAVITVREKRAKRYGVDETVNMADSLPIWEQNVSVELPAGTELFWTGRDMKAPTKTKNGSVEKYSWQVMNQLPWNGEGFVLNERPMVSYSTKKGAAAAIRSLNEAALMMPPLDKAGLPKGDPLRAGKKLIDKVNSPKTDLHGVPENWVRPADQIPAEGPWTPWEKTLLLNRWLSQLGWESSILWEAKMPVEADSPASPTLFSAPVLKLKARGTSKDSYFMAGLPYTADRTPYLIAGSELYSLDKDGALADKKMPTGSAADNRLALLWVLKLDDQGRAEGKLEVTATGGWSDLFSGSEAPTMENLSKFIAGKINFAIPGMQLAPASVKELPTGYRLDFSVICVPGIIHGPSMLLRLPGGIPMRVSEMIGRENKYTLRFPFMIDQKVRMQMRGGFHMLQTPPLKQLGTGTKTVLKETITHWPKKAQLLADSLWVVKTREVDGTTAQLMKEELAAALRWPVLDLPFRKTK